MGLFSSRFKALEALVDLKADDRKPEHLTAAQAELDKANAGVLLVPTNSQFKTGEDLDKHIDALEKTSKAEKDRADKAESDLKAANAEVTRLKAIVPADGQQDTPNTGKEKEPPAAGEETAAQKEQKELTAAVNNMPHMVAMRRHFGEE